MVRGILADADIIGQVRAISAACHGPTWADCWLPLELRFFEFADVGLSPDAKDSAIWFVCQQMGLLLMTANRNHDDADSLEATLRAHGDVNSLPVLTLADADRVLFDRNYADRVVARTIEVILDLDTLRGCGRVFVP